MPGCDSSVVKGELAEGVYIQDGGHVAEED